MEHEATYTFSRALHMMRYGGKKMRCIGWAHDKYLFICDNTLHLKSNRFVCTNVLLENREIMGSWVEVKE